MRVVRLECDNDSLSLDRYNKLFVFNPENGLLQVYSNDNFILPLTYTSDYVLNAFNVPYIGDDYKLIINPQIEGSYSFPFKLFIDITDRCNLNCKHCLTKNLNLGNELELESILDIAKECAEGGVFYVKLGGGEPLLHPHIHTIVAAFTRNNIAVSLSTNGLCINDDIARFLFENNVKVSVSIEGPKNIDEEIRGEGHFDLAVQALQVLQLAGCKVSLRVTLTRKLLNVELIQQLIDLSLEYAVPLKFSYCRPAGNAIDNELLIRFDDYREYYEVLKLINSSRYSHIIMDEGMQFVQPQELKSMLYSNRICGSANRSMHINSAGFISPCVFLGTDYIEEKSKYTYGDIHNYWTEIKGCNFRRIRNINIPDLCLTCNRLCKYECLATRYYTTGAFTECDPNCLINVLKKCQEKE